MEHIKIGGHKRPLHFSFNALSEISALINKPFLELANPGANFTMDDARYVITIGLRYGLKAQGGSKEELEKITTMQVGDWIDQEPAVFRKAILLFSQRMGLYFADDTDDEEPEGSDEKK